MNKAPKNPTKISKKVLEQFAYDIQAILYWVDDGTRGGAWDVNKEWDSETLDEVSRAAARAGLEPR